MFARRPGRCEQDLCVLIGCGDGHRDDTEDCDGDDLGGKTCGALQFYGQTTGLKCNSDCRFDTSGCVGICGDRSVSNGEVCDGAPPEGRTCLDAGYDRGLVACASSCGPTLDGCSKTGWQADSSTELKQLTGIWGTGPNDVFAVGPMGDVVHWDGRSWFNMLAPKHQWNAVWGTSATNVYAVGVGTIAHWDGAQWSDLLTGPQVPIGFTDVWGSGPDDVFVAGNTGALPSPMYHWNGQGWLQLSTPPDFNVGALWGSGPNDVFGVGASFTTTPGVFHWDGSRWAKMSTPVPPGGQAIWGSGPSDVYVPAGVGRLLHWDGAVWSEKDTGSSIRITGLWGSGPRDVLAHGFDGSGPAMLRWDGVAWSQVSMSDRVNPYAHPPSSSTHYLWGTSADDVYAVDQGIWRSSGTNWFSALEPGGLGPLDSHQVNALWAFGANDVFAMGLDGFIHWKGSAYSSILPVGAASPDVFADDLWASGPNDAWGLVSETAFVHWDGTKWTHVAPSWFETNPGLDMHLEGLGGSGRDDVFAVGWPKLDAASSRPSGPATGLVTHWDGHAWSTPAPVADGALLAVWATGARDAFAVGVGGTIVHWDGGRWSAMASGSQATLLGVWGSGPDDVYAVGEGGAILHFDGKAWAAMKSPTTADLGVVRGSGAGDVFAAATNVLLHLRGGGWERIALPVKPIQAQPSPGMGSPTFSIYALAVTPSRVILGGTGIAHLDRFGVTCVGPETNCGDGWDNDCDGLQDGADPDCAGKVAEQCANLADDDGDQLADCADPDCAAFPSCRPH
jgi:hypothetical protein